MPKQKRSPIKDKPLRYPGQSINESIQDLQDGIIAWFLYCASFIVITIFTWFSWLTKTIIPPIFPTIISIGLIILTSYKTNKTMRQIQLLKMARDGEMTVGQDLDDLRQYNYQIFHDIQGEGFNIDHVVLTTHGFFTVETKTISKPLKGNSRIHLENKQIFIDGFPMDRNPFNQCHAQAHWLQNLLLSTTGKKFMIKPTILFPGWFVDPMQGHEDVWVLNPKALPAFISNEPEAITREDMYLASFHLSRYIRSKQAM